MTFNPKSRPHQFAHIIISLSIGALLAIAMAIADGAEGTNAYTIDQITAAVCQVESGCFYHGPGQVSGRWSVGQYGETGHWQISPMVLRDLHATKAQARDVVTCESLFRRWYTHLLVETGSHYEALAAYHRGLRGRTRADAKDYAQRCLNLAATFTN